MMEMLQSIQKKGWFLSSDGIKELTNSEELNEDAIIKSALNKDLRDIAVSTLSEQLLKGNCEICGPLVLQVQKLRNVAAPKANETSQHAPQLLRMYLTDGHTYISALQSGTWNTVSLDTPPGTKILIKAGTFKLRGSFLFLNANQFVVLGGEVASLVEKWLVSRSMVRNSNRGNDGPPPWVSFGQKITYSADVILKCKVPASETEPKDSKSNEAFDEQRKMNIAVVSKSMEGNKTSFGKGKERELKDNHQVSAPKSSYQRPTTDVEVQNKSQQGVEKKPFEKKQNFKESNNFDRGFSGRNKRERRPYDSEDGVSTQPSKQSTLFDFLNLKLDLPEVPSNNKQFVEIDAFNNEEHNKCDKSLQQNSQKFHSGGRYQESTRGNKSYNSDSRYSKHNKQYLQDRGEQRQSFGDSRRGRNDDRYSKSGSFVHEQRSAYGKSQGNSQFNKPVQKSNASNDENYLANNVHFPVLGNEMEMGDTKERNAVPNKKTLSNDSSRSKSYSRTGTNSLVQVNDIVMAKYWEDDKFYQAVVHAVSTGGQTCVVQFIEYGNFEEVLTDDIVNTPSFDDVPIRQDRQSQSSGPRSNKPNQRVPPSNRNTSVEGEVLKVDFYGTMEFRRGGDKSYAQKQRGNRNSDSVAPSGNDSGNYENRRPRNHEQRPSTQFYQPPVRRN